MILFGMSMVYNFSYSPRS